MSRGVKNAVVIVVDVGSHVTAAEAALSRTVVGKLLQQPFLNQGKFEVSLVLVGTKGTDNDLNRQLGDYEHVTVAQQLDVAESDELLGKVAKKVAVGTSGGHAGDYVDGLIVALQLLDERCSKGKYTRALAVVSGGAGPLSASDEHLDNIASQLKASDCKLTFASVRPRAGGPGGGGAAAAGGDTELAKIMRRLGADVVTVCDEADAEKVSQPPPVAPTTVFRGPLEISDRFSIGVWAYNSVSAVTAPSLKKQSIPATEADPSCKGEVKMHRAYFSVEDPDTEVAPEDQIKGHKCVSCEWVWV